MFETNGGTRSDVKDVIKKLPENARKQKCSEKTKMMQMIGLIQAMLIKIWNCIMGIIFMA